jgi:hypothetical protein
MKPHTRTLLNALLLYWQSPANVDATTQSVIDSFFSRPSAGDLQLLLDAADDPDLASVEQLLFFPDARLQQHLEHYIENTLWEQRDLDDLADALARTAARAWFCLAGGRGFVRASLSPPTAAAVVDRLHLLRRIDPRVRRCMETHIHPGLLLRAKVFFRNSRFLWTESRVEFLCLFFEKALFDDLFEPLAFVLDFLCEAAPEDTLLEALFKKKRRLFSYLQLARRADARRKSATMETIIGAGIRIPHVDQHQTLRQMNYIDRITRDLYGKVDDTDALVLLEEAALNSADADALFRLLQ